MLDPRQTREAVHVLLLRELLGVRRGEAIVLKGGVNLRLFHGSPRYSEDIDLDGDPEARLALRERIRSFFEDPGVIRAMKGLGLRGLDPKEGPNKDTLTTFRYKFHVLGGGRVGYPTKIEVSFREPHPGDDHRFERPEPGVYRPYLGEDADLRVPHYTRPAAVRQKLDALAGRSEVQARDVFDLAVLVPRGRPVDPDLLEFLAENMDEQDLVKAHDRAFALDYAHYEGQVVEFLRTEERDRYHDPGVWETLQLRVSSLVDQIRDHGEPRS